MSGSRAAIRYAKAVLEQAKESGKSKEVFADMQTIQATIASSKDLKVMLKSPVIKAEDKRAALHKIFSNQNAATKGLIDVLVNNQRTDIFGNVADSFIDLYNTAQGVKVAKVTTAVPLNADLESKVLAKVKELTGSSQVTIDNKVDEAIIGGFILRIGDLQYNASIANKLGNIKREFSKSL